MDVGSYVSSGVDVNAHRIDVFGPNCEVHALLRSRTQLISCSISADLLQDRASSTAFANLAEHLDGHRVVPSTGEVTTALCRSWRRFLDLARGETLTGEAYERMLDEVLLLASRALSPEAKGIGCQTRRRYKLARRAREYMQERQSDPPSIPEVCAFLNTSERTLHYAFSQLFGVSPMRFLKTQRLFAVNQALNRCGESL